MESFTLINDITPEGWVLFFAFYSFVGWTIEVAYRSITQKRFINAGFLHGPFVPIYGFGAVFIILLEAALHPLNIIIKLLAYGMALTLIEYLAGYLFERIFRLKLWDYSDNAFNLHGRICLLFSLFWTGIAFIFASAINPIVSRILFTLDGTVVRGAAAVFLVYGAVDFTVSAASMTSFRRTIARLYREYLNLTNGEIEKIFESLRRLRAAFPHLDRYIDRNINDELRQRITGLMQSVREKLFTDLRERKPLGREFQGIVGDIYRHPEFMRLKDFYHHNSSIYDHVMGVSYFSYRVCKYLKLDYRSAARGALLHDFFLYDWRNHDEPDLHRDKFHGLEHPRIALRNAEKYFTLNDIERDIIVKHMWPLTLVPPRYKESCVVTFADKYLSSKEFIDDFTRHRTHGPARKPGKKGNSNNG